MHPELSIVIVNWNVAGLLAQCLESLPGAVGVLWGRCEVLVVDNASSDGSVELVRRRFSNFSSFPNVRLLALPRNLGFTGGNNKGILASRGEYILLLNPDTVALPGSIALLRQHMAAHPHTGIVGPRLLNPDGTLQPSRRRFPTLPTALLESTPLQRWLGQSLAVSRFYMLDRPEGETQPVDWLSGAALFCRRESLRQAGLLDPGYFMFSEEVDLCRRVKSAGWRVEYLPSAELIHYGGGSTGQDVPARHINFNTSKARYFRLHEGEVAGNLLRRYLLALYLAQSASEAAKWLLGHKRALRAGRLRLYRHVLQSGLRERHGAGRVGRAGAKRATVLLITGEYPPMQGGVGDYTCRLNGALQAQSIAVRVLTRRIREPAMHSTAAGDRAELPASGPFRIPQITLGATLRALRATRARIAHIQYQTGAYELRPTVNFLPALLNRAWGRPVVVTFHDLRFPYLFPKAGPLRDFVNYVMARTASAAIATNAEDYARLQRWRVPHLRLVPIGSNIPNNPPAGYDRTEWRQRYGAGAKTVLLAYFGFLNSSKGLDDLLRALQTLRQSGDFRLLIVGGGLGSSDPTNRETAARLDSLARELGVGERIAWTGFLAPREVSAALLAADIAVLPYADGASLRRGSLLAALAHGLPLVTTLPNSGKEASSIGGALPQLEDGHNALLVEAGNAEMLAAAIGRVAADGELRTRLANGAREIARFFSWAAIAEQHAQLYSELLGSSQDSG